MAPDGPVAGGEANDSKTVATGVKTGKNTIIISSGTNNATKVHVAVVNGFALVKGDPQNKVDFILMAEGGWVVDDKTMRSIKAFGLPPMDVLLDAPEMNDAERVSWTV